MKDKIKGELFKKEKLGGADTAKDEGIARPLAYLISFSG